MKENWQELIRLVRENPDAWYMIPVSTNSRRNNIRGSSFPQITSEKKRLKDTLTKTPTGISSEQLSSEFIGRSRKKRSENHAE